MNTLGNIPLQDTVSEGQEQAIKSGLMWQIVTEVNYPIVGGTVAGANRMGRCHVDTSRMRGSRIVAKVPAALWIYRALVVEAIKGEKLWSVLY